MKYFFGFIFCCMLFAGFFSASGKKHKRRGDPKTEVELINDVVSCLRHKDTADYYYLFPPFDTLWRMVNHNSDHSPEAEKQLAKLRNHPQSLIDFDPFYNHQIMGGFCHVLAKGEDSGINWKGIVVARYELQAEGLTRDLEGFDKIVPERYKGYLFVKDVAGRSEFCITIKEIQKLEGHYFGGQVVNILEASTIDQYLAKEIKEQQYFEWLAKHPIVDTPKVDSAKAAAAADSLTAAADDDAVKIRKEVVDRKYYEGMFDNEIPVKLYVRYMKDLHTGKVAYYDGLYKFGDQKSYVRLDITLMDGKWVMEDDPPVGTLELVLKDKIYTGSWLNNDNGTGYDVLLKQTDLPQKRMEELEKILERGLSGAANQETLPEKSADEVQKEKEKKRNEDRGNDGN